MKKRALFLLLVLCLTLSLLPVLPVGAYGNDIAYPVTGGNIYFDKKTGTITSCDDTITAANIPEKIDGVSVTTIGFCAFEYRRKLTSVTIPNSVTEIGFGAFHDCTGLTSVTIPDSVTTINDSAFELCTGLTSVTLPSGLTKLESSVFSDCRSLASVTIPAGVTEIGRSTFFRAESLTSVTIPAGVKKLGEMAFYSCNSLTGVYFLGDAPEIEARVFHSYAENDPDADEDDAIVANPNLTLYYIDGKAGWTTPTWNGYRTATWDGEMPAFTDVPANAWFAGAVDYAVENGLMNGMGNNQFQPNTSMTRAMLVTVLWRYAESPKQGENTFTDVPAGKYYTEAVAWAAANGIVNGVGNGKFNPDGNITREQLVTILYRYCKQLGINTSKADSLTGFPDAGTVGNSALDAMRWAVAEKLIGGKTLDASQTLYLQPKGSATRAEVATILMRFIENILKKA